MRGRPSKSNKEKLQQVHNITLIYDICLNSQKVKQIRNLFFQQFNIHANVINSAGTDQISIINLALADKIPLNRLAISNFMLFQNIKPSVSIFNPKFIDSGQYLWHYPDRQRDTYSKLIQNKIGMTQFVEAMPIKLPSVHSINRSLQQLPKLNKIQVIEKKKRRTIFMYGEAGSGKSTLCMKFCRQWAQNHGVHFCENIIYRRLLSEMYWGGYTNQNIVVYDDVHPDVHISLIQQIRSVSNISPCKVPVKGSHIDIFPDLILFTSQYPPYQLCKGDQRTIDAWKERMIFISVKMMTSEFLAQNDEMIEGPKTIVWTSLNEDLLDVKNYIKNK